ncbi:hypothetical protein CYANOKiyG1_59920 [Okeania sp. KiyG1]|nr:hypothetical protein CYANOKiyG1_59920 [Okeania sp. KiyG1]
MTGEVSFPTTELELQDLGRTAISTGGECHSPLQMTGEVSIPMTGEVSLPIAELELQDLGTTAISTGGECHSPLQTVYNRVVAK